MTDKRASAIDTTNAAAYFICLHGFIDVDEDGFLVVGQDHDKVMLGKGENSHPIIIYQDPMPKADVVGTYWVCNPFSTSARASTAMRFIFRAQRVQVANLILNLLKQVIVEVLNNKEVEIDHDEFSKLEIGTFTRSLVAKKTEQDKNIAEEIDEKMFHEVLRLIEPEVAQEFVQRIYVPAKLSTHINIPFLNNEMWFKEKFDISLRKKTLYTLKALILGIFNVKDSAALVKTYTGVGERGEPTNFSSGMRMLLDIHKRLNPYFEGVVESNVVDTDILEEQIGKIKSYTARARMVTADKVTKPEVVQHKLAPLHQEKAQAPAPAVLPQAPEPFHNDPTEHLRKDVPKFATRRFVPPPQTPVAPQPAYSGGIPVGGVPVSAMVGAAQPVTSRGRSFAPSMPRTALSNVGYTREPLGGGRSSYPVDQYGTSFGTRMSNAPYVGRN